MESPKTFVLGIAAAVLAATGIVGVLPTEVAKPQSPGTGGTARGINRLVRSCGVNELIERDVDLIERFVELESRRQGLRPGQVVPADAFIGTIPVAFHVVYANDGTGLLSQTDVNNQIDVLNAAYSNVGFQLVSTTFTNNEAWFFHFPGSLQEQQMKQTLGVDTSRTLNIYSTGLIQIGLLGYATFPWNQRQNPTLDGVVIAYDSLPGGSAFPYDEGDTATHEVGHWLGLFHTFQGGCRRRNDGVSDTPAEFQPFFGCTMFPPDTCPAPGSDPINNFMDYSDDACLFEFSPGQNARMNQMVLLFRPNVLDN